MNSDFTLFKDGWKNCETVCGWGSTSTNTKNILIDLPNIVKNIIEYHKLGKIRINDAGCGDLYWIQNLPELTFIDYRGYDLYERESWLKLNLQCSQLDICQEKMRDSHLIICRDVFIHWPNNYILKALELFRQTSQYLYSTTYTGEYYEFENTNRITECNMHHCKLNLCSSPFNLGKPLTITLENYHTQCCQKLMCLWKLYE